MILSSVAAAPAVASALSTVAVPALPIAGSVLLTLWSEVRAKTHTSTTNNANHDTTTALDVMTKNLQSHRAEKVHVMRNTFPTLFAGLLVSIAVGKSLLLTTDSPYLGPPAKLVALSFAFWCAEITMDSALDECASAKPFISIGVSGVTQLLLIFHLVTSHIVFSCKAVEVLLATFLAKVVDTLQWAIVAVLATACLGACGMAGMLPSLPVPVKPATALIYFGCTAGASLVYQLVQNNGKRSSVAAVQTVRSMARVVALYAGVPLSWIVYDTITFPTFLLTKILVDTVALHAATSSSYQNIT